MADVTLVGSIFHAYAGTIESNAHLLSMDFPVAPMTDVDLGAIIQEGLLLVSNVTQTTDVIIFYGIVQTHVLAMQNDTMTGSIPDMAVSQTILLAVPSVDVTSSIPAMSLTTWPLLAVDPVTCGGSVTLTGITQTHLLQVASNTIQKLIPSIVMNLPDKCPSPKCQLEQVDQVNYWDTSTGNPDLARWATSPLFRLTVTWEQLEKRYKDWIVGYCDGYAGTGFSFQYIYDGWAYNCVIEAPPRVSYRNDSQYVDVAMTLLGYRESQWVA